MDDTEHETDYSFSELNPKTSKNVKRLKRLRMMFTNPDTGSCTNFTFTNSTRMCLQSVREAILHHRWEEASQSLGVYSQILEETTKPQAFEIIWRLGVEILQHHPNGDVEKLNNLYKLMKSCSVHNYATMCLEYAFHLLLNGHMQKAKQQLMVAMSWRYGKESIRQARELKLIQAYCSFLDYLGWSTKRAPASEADDGEQDYEAHSYFRQALVTMQEIIKQPGVWDPFVCSCVDMLEYSNNEEEALQLLKHYAYNKDFPANPNAHIYLYKFQKKHNASSDDLLATLKELHSLVPSHELMLEYCKLLIMTKDKDDLPHALAITMDLLEFSCWKTDLNVWLCLLKVVNCFKHKTLRPLLKEEWEGRKDLWKNIHYKFIQNKMDLKINPRLVLVKTKVRRMFGFRSLYGEYGTLRKLNAMYILDLKI